MRVVCRNEECRDSFPRRADAPQLQLVKETASCWTFQCDTCAREGRISLRAVTKDVVGGTVGQGKTDDGRGKGLRRFTQGIGEIIR